MIIQFIEVDFSMAIGLNDYVFFFVLNEHTSNGGFCGFAHVTSYSQTLPSYQASLSSATFGNLLLHLMRRHSAEGFLFRNTRVKNVK